jgi:hypothetical protein
MVMDKSGAPRNNIRDYCNTTGICKCFPFKAELSFLIVITQKIFDGYKRSSDFLTLSDGTRLAYDVYLPTKKALPADKPYPA